MHLTVHERIDAISTHDWDRVAGNDNPFVRHGFLAALEHNNCVGEGFGWLPRHLAVHDDAGRLVGAAPLYLKDNSYGEFVFDWSWADAYERLGRPYYPKLVSAAPYTPATGPRLLVDAGADRRAVGDLLIRGAIEQTQQQQLSSLHWLFPTEPEMAELQSHGLLPRLGCQYHWHNNNYETFEDFLATFSAQKRKKTKRERRRVQESGLTVQIAHGHEATDEQLQAAEFFYRSTFDRKWGYATFNLGFFREVAERMGESLVLFFALEDQHPVAGSVCFRSRDTLYGRHWGCIADYHSLHFELCYYQGIDYCIRNRLQHFEPGAQGEYKISRGFVPTATWSAHWIADPEFRAAVADFVRREERAVRDYMATLEEHTPYKAQTP